MTSEICKDCGRPLKEGERNRCARCRQERVEAIKKYIRKVGTGAGAVAVVVGVGLAKGGLAVGRAAARGGLATGRAAAKGGIAAAKQLIRRYL